MEEETKVEEETLPLEPFNDAQPSTPSEKLCQYTLLVVLNPEGGAFSSEGDDENKLSRTLWW